MNPAQHDSPAIVETSARGTVFYYLLVGTVARKIMNDDVHTYKDYMYAALYFYQEEVISKSIPTRTRTRTRQDRCMVPTNTAERSTSLDYMRIHPPPRPSCVQALKISYPGVGLHVEVVVAAQYTMHPPVLCCYIWRCRSDRRVVRVWQGLVQRRERRGRRGTAGCSNIDMYHDFLPPRLDCDWIITCCAANTMPVSWYLHTTY